MTGDALRDRMMFFLNHMMKLRGESLREINLNHMFSLEFKDEGYNLVFCVYYDYHGQNYEPGTAYVV